MTGRRANTVRGPRSALTDFLAANNISASNIRQAFNQRVANATEEAAAGSSENADSSHVQGQSDEADPANVPNTAHDEDIARDLAELEDEYEGVESAASKKRKRASAAYEKAAAAKAKAASKKKKKKSKGNDSEDDEWRDFESGMSKKKVQIPGQLDNCELCSKRFTVTPYSKEGPDGGLLCTPCGKQMKQDDAKAARANNKKAGTGSRRRKAESNRLDGLVTFGPKRLAQLCVEKVVQHHQDVEEFGDMPENVMVRLSEIFSKRRVLTPQTLPLFLRPDQEELVINDAARLNQEDFCRIFSESQRLRKLVLRNAGQLKNSVIDHMMEKTKNLCWLQIYAANLVSNEKWIELFQALGDKLETIKLTWMDAAFTDGVVEALVHFCPNLKRVKLKFCRQLTPACLDSLSQLQHLEHLSLQLSTSPEPDHMIQVLDAVAPRLKTLSLEGFYEINDKVLAVLRTKAASLDKLRLTEMENVTDEALRQLFCRDPSELTATDGETEPSVETEPSIIPSLRFIDLSGARDVDYVNAAGPIDVPIGLGAASFTQLMQHSGDTLQTLRIASCRHIPFEGFGDAFSPAKKAGAYRNLREINLSFCAAVDTNVIQGIFAACPKMERCIAFGCFGIEDVVVPRGVALIGVPRAQDAIEKIGEWSADAKGKKAAASFLDDLAGAGPVVGAVGA